MLYSGNIRLRPIEREDLPRFVAWFADPEVREGLALYLGMSLAQEQQWFEEVLLYLGMSLAQEQQWFEEVLRRPRDEQPLAIEVQEADGTWRHIGSVGIHSIDWRNSGAEVGIAIGAKSYWNQGLGTRVMQILLRHAFETLNLHRVFLRVYETNTRAQRAYEKAGFVLEGRFREAEFRNGAYQDVRLYSVLREEWESREKAHHKEPT